MVLCKFGVYWNAGMLGKQSGGGLEAALAPGLYWVVAPATRLFSFLGCAAQLGCKVNNSQGWGRLA